MKLLLLFLLVGFTSYSQVDHWETVVYETNTWRYLVPTSPVSATWNTLAYNDASWNTGIGGFGFGDGDDNTNLGSGTSCYQRIVFNIVDVNAIDLAVLNVDYDDGFVAYLNGVEITRGNITSAGQPAYDQYANGNHEAQMYSGGSPDQFIITSAFLTANLVNGNNVLCVQTHNANAWSSDMSSRVWLHLGINDTSSNYGSIPGWFNPPLVFMDSNLPIVVIETAGGATIPNEPKIDATMGIIYNGPGVRNYMTDPFNEYEGDIGIEIRGSSSAGFPKKQWGLETRDPMGNVVDVSIFNMAYDNDWVLYAPYSDKSLMRNVLAYKMGWDTEQYAPRTKLVEVVLNGEYQGVYVFTEKIKRKDGKTGINDVEPTDVTGNELTGDYIMKVDKLTAGGQVAWVSPYPPYSGAPGLINMQMHDPALDSLVPTQLTYIENVVTAFEGALYGGSFLDPVNGYAKFVDMESFVDFMLVNEFSKNVDGYRISTFFHKRRDSEGGKIVAGPLWDFNLAFGNANYCQGGNTFGWEIDFYNYCGGGGLQNPFWWERFTQDPTFTHLMHCRWLELRQGKWHDDSLTAYIDNLANYLDEAQQRNFQRWPVLGTYLWPNNFVGTTYAEEINYLKTWILTRAAWMDGNLWGSCADLGISDAESNQFRLFPNPTEKDLRIEFPYLLESGELILVDAAGRVVLQLTLENCYAIDLDLHSLESGIYNYKLIESGKGATTGKLIKK